MLRDGFCKSLWQENTPAFLPASIKRLPGNSDVIIVGAGITGLTTALLLQRAGKNCVVIEAKNIGFGTTGGTSAHLNTLMDTPYYQIKKDFGAEAATGVAHLTLNAIELIKRNIAEFDIACNFLELPGFIFSQNRNQDRELEDIIKSTRDAGLNMDHTDNVPTPVAYTKAAVIAHQAQFHPVKYLYGIAEAFEHAGGRIIPDCRVSEVIDNAGTLEVTCGLGKITTKAVVYATHIPPGVNILHFRCAPYRSYVMAVTLKDNNYPLGLVYDMEDPYHYYRTQEIDGIKYLVAGGEDHKTAHEENTGLCFAKLESYLRKFYNVDKVAYKWSSQYFEPADGLPYIGRLPGNPENVYVASGFGGNGIIYGTAAGLILTDLICSGKSEYKDLFNPMRVKPIAGFENVIKEAADVAGTFIVKRLSIDKLDELVELARGEAKVVKHDNRSIALYKDETGKVFALSPSCPHIGCIVTWNGAEKSWDCPCHGSRFSFTGELLTGPSRKNLDVIDLE